MTDVKTFRELVNRLHPPERSLDWLAEMCLQSAVDCGALEVADWTAAGFPTVGAFRSFLARIVSIGRKETGWDLDPYGDNFPLLRTYDSQPFKFDVKYTNTMSKQSLSVTAVSLPVPSIDGDRGTVENVNLSSTLRERTVTVPS